MKKLRYENQGIHSNNDDISIAQYSTAQCSVVVMIEVILKPGIFEDFPFHYMFNKIKTIILRRICYLFYFDR